MYRGTPQEVFKDLPEAKFPIRITMWDADTGDALMHGTLEEPGAMEIPAFPGRRLIVAVRYATGELDTYEQPVGDPRGQDA